MKRKRAEEQMRRRLAYAAEHNIDVIWVDVKWLDALGRERVQEIVREYDYGDLQSTIRRTKLGAMQERA